MRRRRPRRRGARWPRSRRRLRDRDGHPQATANDSRSATLSAGRTPSSHVTVRPPASSSQSSEKTRIRSTARSATRKRTTIRSEPSSRTTFLAAPDPAAPGARVAIDVPSAEGSSRHARQHPPPSDITTFPLDPGGVAAEAAHDAFAVDDRHRVTEPGHVGLARYEGAERLRERRSRGLGSHAAVGDSRLLRRDGARRRAT